MVRITALYILHRRVPHRTPERPAERVVRMRTTVKHARRPVHRPTTPTTDYATMPMAARKALLADQEAHYLHNNPIPSPFDPGGLPELALAQWPDRPALAEAFRCCTQQWAESDYYTYLVFPYTPEPLAIAETLRMDCPVRGGLFVDVLKDGRIGGIEFLDKLFGEPTSAHALFGAIDDLLDEAA